MNTFILLSSILNLVASAFLSFAVFAASGRSVLRSRFLVFLFSITGWSLFYFFWQISDDAQMAYWSCVGLIISASFVPVTFYHLALALAEEKANLFLYLGYCLALIATVTAPFGGLVARVAPKLSFPYWPEAGPFLYLVILIYALYVVLSALTLMRGAREHVGMRSTQMRFVLGSAAIGFIGGSTNFPLWYDILLPPYGNFIVFIYLLMVGYGIYNQQIKGISVDVFKTFILLLLTASFSMFYVFGISMLSIITEQPISITSYWIQGITCFFVVSFLFWAVPKLKAKIDYGVERLFRKDRLSTVVRLEALSAEISGLMDTQLIFSQVCEKLHAILNVSGVALYHRRDFETQYSCHYACGPFPAGPESPRFDLSDPLIERLSRKTECIDPDLIFDELSPDLEDRLVELKQIFNLSLIIPIFAGSKLTGMIIVGKPADELSLPSDQYSLLFAVGAQVGLNLQARDLERKANEVDKLVALGTMAAGLAHEIRNPLVSVQTLASMLAGDKALSQVGSDFKQVLLRDVKRISNIVEGVAMFSDSREGRMLPTHLREAVEASCEIYCESMKQHGITLSLDLDWEGQVLANRDQLGQVFNNLIENSIEAMADQETRRMAIIVQEITLGVQRSWVEISFSDSGTGVPEDIRSRIFDPFITSKDTGTRGNKEGMGLGLAICKRIIESHEGAISVSESRWGGAKFTISLKVFEASME